MVYAVNLNTIFGVFEKIPVRLNVGIMLFMASFTSYMLRVNFSISIIAMTNINATEKFAGNQTGIGSLGIDEHFGWSKKEQGLLLSAYFYGYIFPNLIGGMLSEKFGGRIVIFTGMVMSAILTGVAPFAANENFIFLFMTRLILGLMGGFLYPACHNIISKWAPFEEKGKFVSALLGGVFGTVCTWPMVGYLTQRFGWSYGFYVPAVFALIISVFWLYFVSDSPSNHPRIQKGEKDLIEKSIGSSVSSGKKSSWPPMKEMLMSKAFYSLVVLHFGNVWGLFFLITAAPKFMSEVLKFNLTEAGILSSLPYMFRLIFGFVFGSIGDGIRHKNVLSVTTIRKLFCVFSHIIPGLLLILLCFVGCDPYVCVAIITLSLGFNGAATMTSLQNSQDLAPNYAGTLYGIINFVGTTSGFISPIVVGYFTQDNSTMDEWQYIFGIGALVYILPAVIFIFFGSGEVQKWNDKKEVADVAQAT